MRKISFSLLVLLAGVCVSCVSEIQPFLKPKTIPIAQRIAEQEKWIDQDIAVKAMKASQAKPIRDKLAKIKKKYEALKAAKKLTSKDSKDINRMLDDTSDQIFRMATKPPTIHTR